MPILTTLLMAACVGVGQGADGEEAPVATGPDISFEIRDIIMPSLEWRGKMMARLEPIARREGVAVWAIDDQGMVDLLNNFVRDDELSNIVAAPRIQAKLGEAVLVSNETAHHYVAHLERISDGPPGEGTQVAFKPEIGEIHDGVRVNLLESHFKDSALFAHVVVEENRLLDFHTVQYSESLKAAPGVDPDVAKASFFGRLRPGRAADGTKLGATLQVPEVASRRVEGEWMLPSNGALLIGLGPGARGDKGSKHVQAERLIAITARVQPPAVTPEGEAAPVQTPEAP